mmetsp:Transcript_37143/g.49275  ORF Transcript_37143/g.49275 Transcript_37143/m.49275 type:complete len:232 (+) Transcript_37143:399-1094(+)
MSSTLSTILESFVGVFMLCLGTFGLIKAFRKNHDRTFLTNNNNDEDDEEENLPIQRGEASMSIADCPSSASSSLEVSSNTYQNQAVCDGGDSLSHDSIASKWEHWCLLSTCCCCCYCCFPKQKRQSIAGILALGIGLVHGVAGPGGVLGVIPAVHLKNPFLAALYLGTFCVTSTVVMGTFAALYGTYSKRLGAGAVQKEFYMEIFSSCLSILVGFTWIVLLSLGILDDVFP